MSLFGGGAECSTSRNPLAQFTKHTGEDRSLQRSAFSQQYQNQSIRENALMNQTDQKNLDRFMNRQDSFNFQPLNNELNNFKPSGPQQQLQNQPSWGAEFQTNSPISPQHFNQQRHQPSHADSKWSSEFHLSHISPARNNVQQIGMNNNLMMSRVNPMLSTFNQRIQTFPTSSQKVNVIADKQWDDQFKEIDQHYQKLSKQEGKQAEEFQTEEQIIIDDKNQANFQEVWDALHEHDVSHELFDNEPASWEKDFAKYAEARANFGQYNFEPTNQFNHSPNAYEIGLTLMQNGAKLSEAALAFEAAVQENSEHVDAWLKLGEVQTQNEKEIAGLTALEKCLALDPENLSALMTLAVSYINEGYDNAAFATLERWIETKYPQVTDKARLTNPKINDEDRYSIHKRVTELYIQAAQLSPTGANIDADVQMGLGVLFYANEEYDKTIDCFKSALSVRPNDELLWNRLGASLANSNRSEEAIEAYHRALQLKPSFVRARYNLGVSSINIGCYKEAAEHLLGALSMHNVEDADGSINSLVSANQSTSIMETLKRAFIAMDRRDLLEKIKPGLDLNQFRGEFNF